MPSWLITVNRHVYSDILYSYASPVRCIFRNHAVGQSPKIHIIYILACFTQTNGACHFSPIRFGYPFTFDKLLRQKLLVADLSTSRLRLEIADSLRTDTVNQQTHDLNNTSLCASTDQVVLNKEKDQLNQTKLPHHTCLITPV
jgi:hypothetical protein